MGLAKAMRFDKAKSLEKAKEVESVKKPLMELTGDELIFWHRQKAWKELVGDSPGEEVEAILQNSNQKGTKDLENQVYRLTRDVPHLRTCSITKSNSIRSVRPIIENGSEKARSVKMAHKMVTELQRMGDWPSPIPEEDEQDSSPPRHPQEQFYEPSSSNDPTDQASHSYKHIRPMSESALEDSSPFEVPGPYSNGRPSHPRGKSIYEIIHSEERGLSVLDHTTKETLPIRRQVKRFDTPVSSTGKGTDSQSELILQEHASSETSTSAETKKLRRVVKANSLHRMFMKGFEKHEDYRAWEDEQLAKSKETKKGAFKRVIDKSEGYLKKYRDFRDWEDAWIDNKVGKFTRVEFYGTVKIYQWRKGGVATMSEEALLQRAEEEEEEEEEQYESEGTIDCDGRSEVVAFSYI
ncbi:4ef1176b-0a6e-4a61-ab99-5060fccd7621-CDS [Sclerotinia trifoliorum]|uniref:4ef1176b-0a6e-4a61-ab99-5060fccd7621-CDS n=1 Tax=Sclerotinia trifoliorum TaxID=28548 RepID=A0A8H2W6S6_9HELO|nr:4ef1176b-0a6e-4a61-ab99-5060fccd7621-CDS [Sclerotinia trifoliorum]